MNNVNELNGSLNARIAKGQKQIQEAIQDLKDAAEHLNDKQKRLSKYQEVLDLVKSSYTICKTDAIPFLNDAEKVSKNMNELHIMQKVATLLPALIGIYIDPKTLQVIRNILVFARNNRKENHPIVRMVREDSKQKISYRKFKVSLKGSKDVLEVDLKLMHLANEFHIVSIPEFMNANLDYSTHVCDELANYINKESACLLETKIKDCLKSIFCFNTPEAKDAIYLRDLLVMMLVNKNYKDNVTTLASQTEFTNQFKGIKKRLIELTSKIQTQPQLSRHMAFLSLFKSKDPSDVVNLTLLQAATLFDHEYIKTVDPRTYDVFEFEKEKDEFRDSLSLFSESEIQTTQEVKRIERPIQEVKVEVNNLTVVIINVIEEVKSAPIEVSKEEVIEEVKSDPIEVQAKPIAKVSKEDPKKL